MGMIDAIVIMGMMTTFAAMAEVSKELEHVSPQKVEELRAQFAAAHPIVSTEAKAVNGRAWKCDMYGVRSRLQVERNIGLYQFAKAESAQSVRNNGAQIVAEYRVKSGELSGYRGPIHDTLRVSPSGTLVAEMSAKVESRGLPSAIDKERKVVAYTVCR